MTTDLDTWRRICSAEPRVEVVALNLFCVGPRPSDRRHPRDRLPDALVKLQRLVGPDRESRRGDPLLFAPESLEAAQEYLKSLAGRA